MLHCDPEEITSGVGCVNFSKIVDTKEEICAIYKYKVQVEYDGLLRKTNLTTEKSNRLSLEAMGDYFFCDISNIFSNILITVKTIISTW